MSKAFHDVGWHNIEALAELQGRVLSGIFSSRFATGRLHCHCSTALSQATTGGLSW